MCALISPRFSLLRQCWEQSRVAYVAAGWPQATVPPRMPPWAALGGGQVSKFCHKSGQKCVFNFFLSRVGNILVWVTWAPLGGIQGGVPGGRRHCHQTSPSHHVRHPGMLRVAPKSLKPLHFPHEKKNWKMRFRPLLCQHFNTWPPPRAAHGGVRGDTVVRRHPAAMYATPECSEWCPSHSNHYIFHTRK